jgi:hypothetical protein
MLIIYENFSQDATHGPDIGLKVVLSLLEKYFRRAIGFYHHSGSQFGFIISP